ncbi:hypothetical protein PVAP13_2NG595420 [Panicum virgatum]|uniref:Arf-GAP domain-containing protein n=1 Tax=Panicum virgatum TaxID=38727 RepID=A0A8T0VTC0_PANVG|nr:hypothetical protein PVAP13_2NG595420 [Panicum virgatum]
MHTHLYTRTHTPPGTPLGKIPGATPERSQTGNRTRAGGLHDGSAHHCAAGALALKLCEDWAVCCSSDQKLPSDSTLFGLGRVLAAFLLRDTISSECNFKSMTFGVFICIKCSGAHRSLGVHISKVCNLVWSKNVNELVSTHGYSQNQIIVWRYPTMSKLATLTGHTYRVLYLAIDHCYWCW